MTADNRSVNRLPPPTVLVTPIAPPWTSAIRFATDSPNPNPSTPRSRAAAERTNGSNSRGNSSSRMPNPESATDNSTPPSNGSTLAVIGVPDRLYLQALSTNTFVSSPKSTGCTSAQADDAFTWISLARGCPDQAVRMYSGSHSLPLGQPRVGVRPCQEQQRLDHPPKSIGLPLDRPEYAPVLVSVPVPPEGNLHLPEQRSQWSAELVGCLGSESPLPLECLLDSTEEGIKCPLQVFQLIPGRDRGEPVAKVGGSHLTSGIGHACDGSQRPSAGPSSSEEGEGPHSDRHPP